MKSDLSLLERKQSDYARSADPWLNFREAADFVNKLRGTNLTELDGAYYLLGLKISRLKNLGQRSPQNESRADTLQDLRGYSAIIQAMEEELAMHNRNVKAPVLQEQGQKDLKDILESQCWKDDDPFGVDELYGNDCDGPITDAEAKALNRVASKLNRIACDKGWWTQAEHSKYVNELASKLLLIHSEISEATECLRVAKSFDDLTDVNYAYNEGTVPKPEGFVVEIVDAIIRCLDILGDLGVNAGDILKEKSDYNETRPHRHGGKNL